MWALGVKRTQRNGPGTVWATTVLPIVFYAGLALLVVSAGTELARRRPSVWRMSMHAVALVVMLYGTAPLVYPEGRYSWLYKTIGVVQYVNAHGQLNRHIDIYQNWPGFFALAAWFGKVAGVASPLAYAKWAQLVFELAALPLLYLIYDALSLTVRQRWLALLLYSASNWIGQDYFSPQALGTLLSLGIMAIALRWLYVGNSRRITDKTRRPFPRSHRPRVARHASLRARQCSASPCCSSTRADLHTRTVALHAGSPAWRSRRRPTSATVVARFVLAAIAVGYLLPRFSFVNSHYGLLNSIGSFFSNATPPSFNVGPSLGSQLLIERCADVLSVGHVGPRHGRAWLRRRSGRPFSPWSCSRSPRSSCSSIQAYGQEGILRVYLFSLPWTAALAALALVSKPGSHRAARGSAVFRRPQLAQARCAHRWPSG